MVGVLCVGGAFSVRGRGSIAPAMQHEQQFPFKGHTFLLNLQPIKCFITKSLTNQNSFTQ